MEELTEGVDRPRVRVTDWVTTETYTGRQKISRSGGAEVVDKIHRTLELLAVVRDPIRGELVGADIRVGSGGPRTIVSVPAALATKRYAAPEWQARTGFGFSNRDARIASEWLADAISVPEAPVRQEVHKAGWVGERLFLPDVFAPSRYREDKAREWWTGAIRHLVETGNARASILLGASAISPQLGRLRVAPFVIHAYGGSTIGKTTAARLAFSVWGNPDTQGGHGLTWNNTAGFVTSTMREHAILPVFLDETGAITQPRPEAEIAKVVMNAASGRDRGRNQTTGERREAETWRLVLISTGEQRITAAKGLTGLGARVVEVPGPFMPDAETADRFNRTASAIYGWLGRWLSEADWPATALPELHASSALANRIRPAVAASAAGFAEVCRLLDVEGFDVVACGQAILDEIAVNLAEVGETPGQRMWDAIQQDVAANPALYPPHDEPLGQVMGRDRHGIRKDGQLYLLTNAGKTLAAQVNVDLRAAMRELADEGRLLTGSGRNLTRKAPRDAGSGQRPDAYVLRWTDSESVGANEEVDSEAALGGGRT